MRSIIFCFFIFLTHLIIAQEYEQAIVTDLNFIRRAGANMYADEFPFYFHYKEFSRDIQNEIRVLVKERFKVKEVLFLNPDSIYYAELGLAPDIEAKDFAVVTKRDKTIFIAIETILQEQAVIDSEHIFRFTTRVNVYDNRGKNIYKFKNHIPFVPVFGDEIAGRVNMSEQDFYAFYFDGLNLAFEGKYKIIAKRYISRPTAEQYVKFTNNSRKFYLQTESTGYTYGQDINNLTEVVSFTENYWENTNNTFNFDNLVTVEILDNGYNFINKFDKVEYTAKLKGGVEALKKKFDLMADIDFQLIDTEENHIGYFVYKGIDQLYGKYKGELISLNWKADYSCIEFYFEEEQFALINYFPNSKVLYLSENINKEQLTALMNLLFVYDYAVAIRERMLSVYVK